MDFPILNILFYFKDFIYLLLEKGREKEKERNITVWLPIMHPQRGARTPGMCPDWESKQQPFGLQAGAQSTEPHQPGPYSEHFKSQVANTRSTGQTQPSTLFYPAQHLVSTRRQQGALSL